MHVVQAILGFLGSHFEQKINNKTFQNNKLYYSVPFNIAANMHKSSALSQSEPSLASLGTPVPGKMATVKGHFLSEGGRIDVIRVHFF